MVRSPQRQHSRGGDTREPLLLSAVLANPRPLAVSRKIANEGMRARQLAVSLCSLETPVASRSHLIKNNGAEDAKRAAARTERIEALRRWQRHDGGGGGGGGSPARLPPPLSTSPVQQLTLPDSGILTKEALGDLVNKYVYALGEEAASGVSSPAMPASPTTVASGAFPAPSTGEQPRSSSSPHRSRAQRTAQAFLKRVQNDAGGNAGTSAGAASMESGASRRQRDANLIDIGNRVLNDTMSSFVKECGFVTVTASPQELRARRMEEEESFMLAKKQQREAEQGYIRQAMVKETERQVRHLLKHVVHIKHNTSGTAIRDILEAKLAPITTAVGTRGALVSTAGGHSVGTIGSSHHNHSSVHHPGPNVVVTGALRRKHQLADNAALNQSSVSYQGSTTVGALSTTTQQLLNHSTHTNSDGAGQAHLNSYVNSVYLTESHAHQHDASVLSNTIEELLLGASSLPPHRQHHHNNSSALMTHISSGSAVRTSTAGGAKATLLASLSEPQRFRLGVLLRCAVALVALHFPTSRTFVDTFRRPSHQRSSATIESSVSGATRQQHRLPLSWIPLVASLFPRWFPCSCATLSEVDGVVAALLLTDNNNGRDGGIQSIADAAELDMVTWLAVCAALMGRDENDGGEVDARPPPPQRNGGAQKQDDAPTPFTTLPQPSPTSSTGTVQSPRHGSRAAVAGGSFPVPVTCPHSLLPSSKDVMKVLLEETPVSCPPPFAQSHARGGTTRAGGDAAPVPPTTAEVAAMHKLQLSRRLSSEMSRATPLVLKKGHTHQQTVVPHASEATLQRYVTGLVSGVMVHSSASYCLARMWSQWLPAAPLLAALLPHRTHANSVAAAITPTPDSTFLLPFSTHQQQEASHTTVALSFESVSSSDHHHQHAGPGVAEGSVDGVMLALFQNYQRLATSSTGTGRALASVATPLSSCCPCCSWWCQERRREGHQAAGALPLPHVVSANSSPSLLVAASNGGHAAPTTLASELWSVPPIAPPQLRNIVSAATSSTSSASAATSGKVAGGGIVPRTHQSTSQTSPTLSAPRTGIVLLALADLDTVFAQHFSAACGAVPLVPLPLHFSHHGASPSQAPGCSDHGARWSPLCDALSLLQARIPQAAGPHGHRRPNSSSHSDDLHGSSWSPDGTMPAGHQHNHRAPSESHVSGALPAASCSSHAGEDVDDDSYYGSEHRGASPAELHMALVAQREQERSVLLASCRSCLRMRFLACDGDRDGAWSWYEFCKSCLTALLATWSRKLHGEVRSTAATSGGSDAVAAAVVDEFLGLHVLGALPLPPSSTAAQTAMALRKRCEALRQVLEFLDSECDAFGFVSTK